MNIRDSRNRIEKLMSNFVTTVESANSAGRTDINKDSETVLIPLLAEVYGYKNLRSLNTTEYANFPAIDLADDEAKVAFQVTSTTNINKVKDTLRKFIAHDLHKKYSRLFIYVLTKKQRSYSKKPCDEILQGSFDFDPATDILDHQDLIKKMQGFQFDKTLKIQTILETNFGEGKPLLFYQREEESAESVHLNLLELTFPSTLYVANLSVDEKSVPRIRSRYRKPYGRRSPRELVLDALKKLELKFGVDWEYYQNQVITFHNLGDNELPLAQLVDQGTVTSIDPEEFYAIDENQERVFKALLRRCLQQKLYHRGVQWQNEDHKFIFVNENGEGIRKEKWQSRRVSERLVFERVMKNNKPGEILQCKHLAFSTQFKRFGTKWYVLIKPDWFFSHDGYRRSRFGSDNIDWIKRRENNSHIFNQLRFIVHFLKHDKQSGLFVKRRTYPFLSFGELLSFGSAPALDDNDWNPPRTEENGDSGQLEMFDL